jgi:hypothetical protein
MSAIATTGERVMNESFFTADEDGWKTRQALRLDRLAPYCSPLSPAIKRGLALEDAVAAVQRAAIAVMDASDGELEELRVDVLKEIYAHLRMALTGLTELK